MQRKRSVGRGMLRNRANARDRCQRNRKRHTRGSQGRHMQRLADVAGRFRTVRVLVEERTAAGEVQQGRAGEQRQAASQPRPFER